MAIYHLGAVKKLRASDGEVLGAFQVGQLPRGVLFDGTSIWVAAYGDNYVVKLDPSDGSPLGRVRVGAYPYEMAFDGTKVWVTNIFYDTITAVRAYNGHVEGIVPVGVIRRAPPSMASISGLPTAGLTT